MKNEDISESLTESDKLLQFLFNALTKTLDSSLYGDLLFKYQGAHGFLEFAYTDERDSENISQADFSNFIFLCEKLHKEMYSYETGAWLSFSLIVNQDKTFNASFDFDGYPTDINGNPLSLDAVKESFKEYPRRLTPEWLV